jgi:dolichyl-phosphate beta-glucosyltransferase
MMHRAALPTERPGLSLVIPAFDEARRLPATLATAFTHLEADGRRFEVIVVDDGSRDDTAQVATEALAPLGASGRLVRLAPNRGKGAAVRAGVRAARGERVLVSDADLSTPIEELESLERALAGGADIAIGSRALDRRRVERRQPILREWCGRLFNLVVQLVVLPGIQDSQCGFKLFRREVVEAIFAKAHIDGFGFDVEILAIARRLGYRIEEVPVRWKNDDDTRVSLMQGAAAFLDPFRVRLGIWRGRYGPRAGV